MAKTSNPSGARIIDLPPAPATAEQGQVRRPEQQRNPLDLAKEKLAGIDTLRAEAAAALAKVAQAGMAPEERARYQLIQTELEHAAEQQHRARLEMAALLGTKIGAPTTAPQEAPANPPAPDVQKEKARAEKPTKTGIKEVDAFIAKDTDASEPALELTWRDVREAILAEAVQETQKAERAIAPVLQSMMIDKLAGQLHSKNPEIDLDYIDLDAFIEGYDGKEEMPQALRLGDPRLEKIESEMALYSPIMEKIDHWFQSMEDDDSVGEVFDRLNQGALYDEISDKIYAIRTQETKSFGRKMTEQDKLAAIGQVKREYAQRIQDIIDLLSEDRKRRAAQAKPILQGLRDNRQFYHSWLQIGAVQDKVRKIADHAADAYDRKKQKFHPSEE